MNTEGSIYYVHRCIKVSSQLSYQSVSADWESVAQFMVLLIAQWVADIFR